MDIVLMCFFTIMYIDLIFELSIFDSYDKLYKADALTIEEFHGIATNMGWLLSPIYLLLIAKVYFGIRAFCKRLAKRTISMASQRVKGPFMSFYVISCPCCL